MTDQLFWILLGFAAALASTAIPLIQEHHKADGYSVAVWIKIVVVLSSFPFVLATGFPTDPHFYQVIPVTALLWAISDVVYFRSIPLVGAGVIARTLPLAAIISFPIWFLFDPALLDKYLSRPFQFAAICLILIGATYFAMQMKKCAVSLKALRLVWFVLFAATVGPLIDKITLGYAPAKQAPFAFMFIQGLWMLGFWGVFALIKKPIPMATFLSPPTIKTGVLIGIAGSCVLVLKMEALRLCEHPALLSTILMTDALWILLFYRAIGRKDNSNIWAGLGIVGCAIALVLVKSL